MTGRNALIVLLGISLLGNALLVGLLLRERAGAPQVANAAGGAEVTAGIPPTATAPATVPPTATSTRPSPVVSPTATLPTQPTATPEQPSPTPEPTALPVVTATATPVPTLAAVGPDWLHYVNVIRDQAGLPPLTENSDWSQAGMLHSMYMVYTGDLRHEQNPSSEYYSAAGRLAAQNSNIAAGAIDLPPYKWAFNYWLSAPFHAVPMLDPQLQTTGYGEYRDASGPIDVTAALDVRRGLGTAPPDVSYPVMFPRDGGYTWVLRYSLPEFPAALTHCGYDQPSGPPVILQLGDGALTPAVSSTAFARDGQYLEHCVFDETNYYHPEPYIQKMARTILDQRDAIVLIPRQPLAPDATYSVRIDANGATYAWSFQTTAAPRE